MILRKHIVKIIKRNHGAEFEYNNVALLNNENFLKKNRSCGRATPKSYFPRLVNQSLISYYSYSL